MSGIKTIILHVGIHKTATTSIQDTLFFEKNNKILDVKGFVYPKWPDNHRPLHSIFCDNPENYLSNIVNGYSKEEIKNKNQYYKKKFVEEIRNKKSSKLIISVEDILMLNKNNLMNLKEYIKSVCDEKINIRVVVYVRNPVTWVVSAIQESIKGGMTLQGALTVYKNSVKTYFKSTIGKLIEVFGKEVVEVYSFENAIVHEFGPVGHFLTVVGFSNNEINKFNIIKSNESLSQISGDIIAYINEKEPLFNNGKVNEQRFFGDIYPLLKVRDSRFDISDKYKKELLEIAMEDIKWLKENVGIDYSDVEIQPTKNIMKHISEETIEDLRKVFHELSSFIKSMTVEYFKNQLKETNSNAEKCVIKDILEGTVNEKIYGKEYKAVNKEELPVVYMLENKPIDISKDVVQIEQIPDGWVIESSGDDPHFILPRFDSFKNKGRLLVKIKITSTVKTLLQLFYISNNIQFSHTHCISRNVDKGYNELIIEINQEMPIKSLRLDPGNVKGVYLLHGFAVRIPKDQ